MFDATWNRSPRFAPACPSMIYNLYGSFERVCVLSFPDLSCVGFVEHSLLARPFKAASSECGGYSTHPLWDNKMTPSKPLRYQCRED